MGRKRFALRVAEGFEGFEDSDSDACRREGRSGRIVRSVRFGYGRDFFSLAQGIVLTVDMPATADEPVQVQGGIPFGDLAQVPVFIPLSGVRKYPLPRSSSFSISRLLDKPYMRQKASSRPFGVSVSISVKSFDIVCFSLVFCAKSKKYFAIVFLSERPRREFFSGGNRCRMPHGIGCGVKTAFSPLPLRSPLATF